MRTTFKITVLPLVALLLSLLTAPASALILIQKVTPDSKPEHGATMSYKLNKDGTYTFTMTRYVATELINWSGLKLEDLSYYGSATLEVCTVERVGDNQIVDKLLAKTNIAAEVKEDTKIFTFSLARECIANSRFSLYENIQPKDKTKPRMLSAVMYQLDLADIDKRLKAAVPLHP